MGDPLAGRGSRVKVLGKGLEPVQGFDWDSFDNPARVKATKHKQVVEIVENAPEPLTKAAITAALKLRRIPHATAYRWLQSAVEDGIIELDKITDTYHAVSHSDSQ